MPIMQTLKEIANEKAKKQPEMVDALTEEAPILAVCRWTAATHGLWNVAEKVEDITGPGVVEMNAPLPTVDVATQLVKTDVEILGGVMEVPKDTADQFGGAPAYFARKQDKVLRKAGMDTEQRLFFNNWLRGAKDVKNILPTAATSGDGRTILAVRFDPDANVGIYDPAQFDQGRLLRLNELSGGQLYHLRSRPGVSGYGVELRGRFGWQMLAPEKTVAAIVNIQPGKLPTETQIDELIALVHGTPANTYLFMSEKTKIMAVNPFKKDRVEMLNADNDLKTMVAAWNGVRIITSYNIDREIPLIK